MSRVAAVLLSFCLAACGMKGPLELPPGPAPTPLLDKFQPVRSTAAPAAKPAATNDGSDVSTPLQTNSSKSP